MVERRTSGTPSLRYLDSQGAGPNLLMLHGVLRRAEDFSPLFDSLRQHFRLIAIDFPGHGQSDRVERYLVNDYATHLAPFVTQLPKPLIIYGHSLGAMVAAKLATQANVVGVILEDPPFHTMGENIHGSAWQAQFRAMQEIALRRESVDQMTDTLAEIRLPGAGGITRRLGDLRDRASLQWSAQCLAQLDPAVLTPLIEGRWLDGYDVQAVLSSSNCPTLILQGDPAAGGAMTDADATFAEQSIADCELVKFHGCGHLLHWLAAPRIAEMVNAFVSRL